MPPAAPAVFLTTTGLPRAAESSGASNRAMRSDGPPATKLTTIVIGAWARAGSAKASIRTPAMTVRMGFPFLGLLRRL